MKKFEEVKNDVKELIFKNLSNSVNFADGKEISECGKRLSDLEETTIKYLMRLTNDYIRAKKGNNSYDLETDLGIFEKYGFDAHVLDDKINEIEYDYNADYDIWPSKAQEEILQTIFSFFECPGSLPKVDSILEIASKFGSTYGDKEHTSPGFEIRWIDTRNFDDPYDTCKHFSTALNNGLSVEQIIELTNELNKKLDYYDAPNGMRCFERPRITSIVPFLNRDHDRMSNARAKRTYEVVNRRLTSLAYSNRMNNSEEEVQSEIHR